MVSGLPEARQLKFEKFSPRLSPLEVFSRLYQNFEEVYLLESMEGPRKLAQYSFLGFDPSITVIFKNGKAKIRDRRRSEESFESAADPLDVIQKLVKKRAIDSREFRLLGGAIGYFSYEAVNYWEELPKKDTFDSDFPDAEFGIFEDGIVFDNRKKRAFYYYTGENRLTAINETIENPGAIESLTYSKLKSNVTKDKFAETVKKAKEYVTKGHIFQVVLSKRYEIEFRGDLIEFYCSLRQINPSPYMYFLKMRDRQIVGSSPEMLVRVDNRVVETFPIAGTRPCGESARENKLLAEELLADPKERAEHVMLVDLARNDLGKVSRFGSVKVTEFMKVRKFSHVQHIVSRVEGRLRDDASCYDALRAVFPAGTVSGAPKIRAMEIIEELESEKRGPYAGAVGYFSYNGNADFAITIRTLFASRNKAYIQTGAGIVADSIPENEWVETEHKAEALMRAMRNSGGENH